ncbi:PTS sugar transporter subunit IIA [Paenibacillus durus]|uniref:PTS glucose transporter subunit IIA n=1 Tax=Paenibacillus durus ATCC 35681 TaxID=1333534 RepID=A0A0F7FCA6_PAEDU|nr:PTS glucose transporter subunit IIA [Paenibacillus durus]AKG35944.1 PTS glucose transporter subunit IIA [Paenibacillus durus ATCC 35681]
MFNKIKVLIFQDKPEQQQEDGFIIPVSGEIIDLSHVPDEAFSQRLMGDGFAIQPENGEVFSPVDGVVTTVVPSKHAFSIKSNSGIEFLIHFGVDTVKLKGEGFEVYVKEGSVVKAGDLILKVNLEEIKDKVPSVAVSVIFIELNGKRFSYKTGKVAAKEKDVVTLQHEDMQ